MSIRHLCAVLALTGCLAGCVSAQAFRSGSGSIYPPTRPESVLVFYAENDVKRPFEVIGEITTAGGHDQGRLIKRACEEAARMGASAILVRGFDRGARERSRRAERAAMRQRVTAIRFTEPAPEQPR